ncbi:hypothetical protein ACHAXA_008110 [Cyclostephanos tholiformis]|uniref:Cyclin N-terminal domain-containing protein n=1 Tax=Cyclostephanos tholiformis TaxID=382380 RepID=A0ABD3SF24_9STRA
MTKIQRSNVALTTWLGDDYSKVLLDQIAVMARKEEVFFSCVDYMGELPMSKDDCIDEEWRQKAAEWMFRVVDYYDLDRDIVNIGMAYLDQVFIASSLHHRWNKKQCGLVPIASLKLAIKLLEPRTMNMNDMLKLASTLGSFSSRAVVEMELEILWKLSWNILPPTAFCFAHHMISLFPREVPKSPTRYILQELTKYMTELAVCKCLAGFWLRCLQRYTVVLLTSFCQVCISLSCSKYLRKVLLLVWSPWKGMHLRHIDIVLSGRLCFYVLTAIVSLDDDCNLTDDAKAIFLERIFVSFGLRHDDKEIVILKRELKALLCHNTDLKGKMYSHYPMLHYLMTLNRSDLNFSISRFSLQEFVALIRASNKPEDSPKNAVVSF